MEQDKKKIEYRFNMDMSNILVWIAIWGIFDNVLYIFVSAENYYLRIGIYIVFLIIAIQIKLYTYENLF
ncbi:hypothetical protein Catovirus_1_258 [Catovirus CTV1]|uniref:Uncharacterized protein n=1 Tax=Catovirus CTV1 TaxID=1977631 RepID=A0A1V0S988_9VIRU|nr:hypothetical protein Catovirus_1_258 [Catovirus CTV1]